MQPSPDTTLSTLEPQHIAPARRLWQATEGVGLSAADEPRALEAFLHRNPGLSLVALDAGQVVGTLLCGHDGRRGLLHHLAVAPSRQRRGIGRRLLSEGLAGLRRAGIDKCHLLVFRSNASGIAFWQAMGAEERTSLVLFSLATRGEA